jgi:hypothetical protein
MIACWLDVFKMVITVVKTTWDGAVFKPIPTRSAKFLILTANCQKRAVLARILMRCVLSFGVSDAF